MARYQRTATSITSAGNRSPANASEEETKGAACFTDQALDLRIVERNGPGVLGWSPHHRTEAE